MALSLELMGRQRYLPDADKLLAVPLLDMGRVMFVRLLRRASMFDPDREHLHYLLIARGWSAPATSWILIAASALGGAVGIGGWRAGIPDWVMFYAFVSLAALLLVTAFARELRVRVENSADR